MCALLSCTSSDRTPKWPNRLCRRVSMSRKIGLSLSRLPPLARFPSSSPLHWMGRSLLLQPWSQPSLRSKTPSPHRIRTSARSVRTASASSSSPRGFERGFHCPERPCVRSARSADVCGQSPHRGIMVTGYRVSNLSTFLRRDRRLQRCCPSTNGNRLPSNHTIEGRGPEPCVLATLPGGYERCLPCGSHCTAPKSITAFLPHPEARH